MKPADTHTYMQVLQSRTQSMCKHSVTQRATDKGQLTVSGVGARGLWMAREGPEQVAGEGGGRQRECGT